MHLQGSIGEEILGEKRKISGKRMTLRGKMVRREAAKREEREDE